MPNSSGRYSAPSATATRRSASSDTASPPSSTTSPRAATGGQPTGLIRFDRVVFVLQASSPASHSHPTPASTATEKRRVMRLRLPARYGGLGLRARSSWLKCAAFLGASTRRSLPSTEWQPTAPSSRHPLLTAVLGVGSFNTGGSKYATILASNTRMGRQLSTAWQQLRRWPAWGMPALRRPCSSPGRTSPASRTTAKQEAAPAPAHGRGRGIRPPPG